MACPNVEDDLSRENRRPMRGIPGTAHRGEELAKDGEDEQDEDDKKIYLVAYHTVSATRIIALGGRRCRQG